MNMEIQEPSSVNSILSTSSTASSSSSSASSSSGSLSNNPESNEEQQVQNTRATRHSTRRSLPTRLNNQSSVSSTHSTSSTASSSSSIANNKRRSNASTSSKFKPGLFKLEENNESTSQLTVVKSIADDDLNNIDENAVDGFNSFVKKQIINQNGSHLETKSNEEDIDGEYEINNGEEEASQNNEEAKSKSFSSIKIQRIHKSDSTVTQFDENSLQQVTFDLDVSQSSQSVEPNSNTVTAQLDANENNNTNDASMGASPLKKKRKRRGSVMDFHDQLKTGQVTVDQLFVYKWPNEESDGQETTKIVPFDPNDDNMYILQEQVSEYLDVKSFKRKYPEIFRRFIDIKEREYLKENKVVTEAQCDLGLTALRLNDCLDIMADDYPEKYKEVSAFLNEKKRKSIAAAIAAANLKRKAEQQAARANRAAMSDTDKMKEMIKKAMKSTLQFNSQLQREKKEERQTFFDLQTMRIQKPLLKTINKPSEPTKRLVYPVTLLSGQYQHFYKRYTNEELKSMPINTPINIPELPEQLEYERWIKEEAFKRKNGIQNGEDEHQSNSVSVSSNYQNNLNHSINHNSSINISHVNNTSISNEFGLVDKTSQPTTPSTIRITASAAPTVAKLLSSTNAIDKIKPCYICNKTSHEQLMIHCSSCPRFSHPACLELNPKLVDWQCIRKYNWQCMDCKLCSSCNQPHDEDKMMFCDRCDRGFHTYCVGVDQVPSGSWLCKTCTESSSAKSDAKMNGSYVILDNIDNSPYIKDNSFRQQQLQQSPSKLHNMSTQKTPSGRGRGRPPGSLNKPKDSLSPKKPLY